MLNLAFSLSFGQAGQDFLKDLSYRLQDYCSSYPWEEIYMHTDREVYISGEDLWFSLYLIDRQTLRLSESSKIAYVEIIDPDYRPVVQKRVMLESGSGPGRIVLPDTLSSGEYLLRAYTNWMKNFLPENCFTKRIGIVNALTGKSLKRNIDLPEYPSGKESQASIPPMTSDGFRFAVDMRESDLIRLSIITGMNFRLLEGGGYCYIFVHNRGNINLRLQVTLPEDSTIVSIPKRMLSPGINHLTVFSSSGEPVFERFIYTPGITADRQGMTVQEIMKTREQTNVALSVADASLGSAGLSIMSISAAPATKPVFPGISKYMVFGSEFGLLPLRFYDALAGNVSPDSINILLSTLRSRWISWERILKEQYPVIKYERESEYHILYGRLINRNTQAPDPGQYLILSIPGKNPVFQYSVTGSDGDFSFRLPIDDKSRDLIIQPDDPERNNSIRIESSYPALYPELKITENLSSGRESILNNRMAVNYQVMRIYSSDESPPASSDIVYAGGTRRFYGKPDIELIMDDYIKLPVMEEVFFELMPGVFLKKRKTGYEVTVSDPVVNKVYEKPPGLFIDGVMIKDPEIIANLDPEKVERIDAVKSRYFVGEYMFFGLVSIITRAGDFRGLTPPDYAVRLPYRLSEPVNKFKIPDYSVIERKQSHLPDFRNTLYWNPSAKPDNEGIVRAQFWTSDFRSEYEINIQGVSSDGRLISASKIIRVQ